jgi:hypothetical protein
VEHLTLVYYSFSPLEYEKFERPRQFFGHVLERFPRCHFAYRLEPNRQKCDQSLSYLFLCRLGQGLDHEHSLHDIDLDGGRELHLYETIKSAYRYRFHFVPTRSIETVATQQLSQTTLDYYKKHLNCCV